MWPENSVTSDVQLVQLLETILIVSIGSYSNSSYQQSVLKQNITFVERQKLDFSFAGKI